MRHFGTENNVPEGKCFKCLLEITLILCFCDIKSVKMTKYFHNNKQQIEISQIVVISDCHFDCGFTSTICARMSVCRALRMSQTK